MLTHHPTPVNNYKFRVAGAPEGCRSAAAAGLKTLGKPNVNMGRNLRQSNEAIVLLI